MSTAPKPAAGIVPATQSAFHFSNPSSGVPYILGHSDAELRRLMLQAAILKPITRRLLLEGGLQPGMRVLDIGCGSGDVSLLLAEMVGSTGSVVGIDRGPAAVALVRDRARAAGRPGITFHEAAAENYAGPAPFEPGDRTLRFDAPGRSRGDDPGRDVAGPEGRRRYFS
jgi:SAM-dependent methyltransferase